MIWGGAFVLRFVLGEDEISVFFGDLRCWELLI